MLWKFKSTQLTRSSDRKRVLVTKFSLAWTENMTVKININKSTHKKRRFDRRSLITALLIALVIVTLAMAQSEAGLDHSRARVMRSVSGSTLTPPSNAAPAAIAADYMRGQGRSEDAL